MSCGYSIWALMKAALSSQRDTPPGWPEAQPKRHYDVIITEFVARAQKVLGCRLPMPLEAMEIAPRQGGVGTMPAVGEAKRGRFADLPAVALCVREGECGILIEHYYAEHLLDWIRQPARALDCG